MAFSFHIDNQQMLLPTRRKGPTVVTTWSIWSPFTIQNGKNPFPYTPCMVYLPTFSWILWYMLDEYTSPMDPMGLIHFSKILETKFQVPWLFQDDKFFLQQFAKNFQWVPSFFGSCHLPIYESTFLTPPPGSPADHISPCWVIPWSLPGREKEDLRSQSQKSRDFTKHFCRLTDSQQELNKNIWCNHQQENMENKWLQY